MAPRGVVAHWRGRPALEPMEIFPSVQRRARCSPLVMAIQNLVVHVGLFVVLIFRLSLVSLFMALFWLRRYWGVMFCRLWLGSTTGLRQLCREVVDQGHHPKERFFVLVLLGE